MRGRRVDDLQGGRPTTRASTTDINPASCDARLPSARAPWRAQQA